MKVYNIYSTTKTASELGFKKDKWYDIPGYEGLYQITIDGKVKSLDRYVIHKTSLKQFCKGQILKGYITPKGYICYRLCEKKYQAHRLVMMTFIGDSDLMVNHKDNNKANNHLDNLEYVTAVDNTRHYHFLKSGKMPGIHLNKHNSYVLIYGHKYIGSYKSYKNALIDLDKCIKGEIIKKKKTLTNHNGVVIEADGKFSARINTYKEKKYFNTIDKAINYLKTERKRIEAQKSSIQLIEEGIHYSDKESIFIVRLRYKHKRIYIGRFKDKNEAKKVWSLSKKIIRNIEIVNQNLDS